MYITGNERVGNFFGFAVLNSDAIANAFMQNFVFVLEKNKVFGVIFRPFSIYSHKLGIVCAIGLIV